MGELKKEILDLLRKNSRSSLSDFSRKQNLSVKKIHYEYGKIKRDSINKFVPVIDFEALGFTRLIVIFHDATEGLEVSSKFKSFFVNNSVRLDTALLVEYLFFFVEEQELFLKEIRQRNVVFDYYFVEEVVKQEEFSFS